LRFRFRFGSNTTCGYIILYYNDLGLQHSVTEFSSIQQLTIAGDDTYPMGCCKTYVIGLAIILLLLLYAVEKIYIKTEIKGF
jgi:hypothetical protein